MGVKRKEENKFLPKGIYSYGGYRVQIKNKPYGLFKTLEEAKKRREEVITQLIMGRVCRAK